MTTDSDPIIATAVLSWSSLSLSILSRYPASHRHHYHLPCRGNFHLLALYEFEDSVLIPPFFYTYLKARPSNHRHSYCFPIFSSNLASFTLSVISVCPFYGSVVLPKSFKLQHCPHYPWSLVPVTAHVCFQSTSSGNSTFTGGINATKSFAWDPS